MEEQKEQPLEEQLLGIVIDLENDPELSRLNLICETFKQMPHLSGLAFIVESKLPTEFWEKIANVLAPIVASLTLRQLTITLNPFEPAQDLSSTLTLFSQQSLEKIIIDGPQTEESINCLKSLFSSRLSFLALPSAGLNTSTATALILDLAPYLTADLDLNFNPIEIENNSDSYTFFCQAILEGTLHSLKLTSINDKAAEYLAGYLAKITRPFHLIVSGQPGLSAVGFKYLIEAVKDASNRYLRVLKEDIGKFIELIPETSEIEALSIERKVPTLFQLAAKKLSHILTEEKSPTQVITSQIPSSLLLNIPIIRVPQYQLAQAAMKNRKQSMITLSEKKLDNGSDSYQAAVQKIEDDYEAELRKSLNVLDFSS